MNNVEWKHRIARRSDMSSSLVHLTRPYGEMKAFEVLLKILQERTLNGSKNETVNGVKRGFICGDDPVVCFQSIPLFSIAENSNYEQELRELGKTQTVRYKPVGLQFDKRYIYRNGGRPVIYEKTITAKSFLPKDQHWRIVNLDLEDDDNLIDWTHEREWRIKGNFQFELSEAVILLPSHAHIKKFYQFCTDTNAMDIWEQIAGIATFESSIF